MLTKEKEITTFEINPDGLIILIEETKIIEDGEVISTKREHRHIIPGQDVTGEEERVQAVCLAVHTPEVVGAYQAKQTQQEVVEEEPVVDETIQEEIDQPIE